MCTRAAGVEPDGEDSGGWDYRGLSLLKLGRPAEALAAHDRALAIDSRGADTWFHKGNALRALGNYAEALAAYDRGLTINPRNAGVSYKRGLVLHALGRHRDAVASYDAVLEFEPNHEDAWYGRARALEALRCPEEAVVSYDHVIALNPKSAKALQDKGALLLTIGQHTDSERVLEQALCADPENAFTFALIGITRYCQGRTQEALDSFDDALAIHSNTATCWWVRAPLF